MMDETESTMTVTNLAGAVINPDGSATITVTVTPANNNEAAFLGYAVGQIQSIAAASSVAAAVANIEALASELDIPLPGAAKVMK
jgi:hypothetical protein